MELPMTNPLNLPEPIAAYFAADTRDADAIARCFTNDAVAKDEGHTYVGPTAIRRWKSDVSKKYDYRYEPQAVEQNDGVTIVTSQVIGNFPGSPADLRYAFRLERGKIAALEIVG
jgi:hypothetical protein